MVGYLLEVDRTAIDPTLIGLSENWVEWFLHGEVDQRTAHN